MANVGRERVLLELNHEDSPEALIYIMVTTALPCVTVRLSKWICAQADAYAAKLRIGGFDEALTRAVLYVIAAERMIDQRSALALNVARQKLMHLSLAEFKALVREQAFLLQLERERAVEALASLVPEADERKELLKQVHAIVGAGDPPLAAERDRLADLSQVLAAPIEKTAALVTSGRASVAGTTARRSAVSQ